MGLSSYTPETAKVEIPGGDFAVRALSFDDIATLVRDNFDTFNGLFERYVNEAAVLAAGEASGLPLGNDELRALIFDTIQEAPRVMAEVVARGAGEPDLVAQARTLPLGVQIEAVEKIVSLTLKAEGGLEKLTSTVTKLVGTVGDLHESRRG